jgi:hypothetical protein
MVAAVSSPKPPRHLLLGKLAIERYREKLKTFEAEMTEWEETTLGADFPGAVATNAYASTKR